MTIETEMKKTIIIEMLDYCDGKYHGYYEKKIYCKNFSYKTIENLKKYDWEYAGNYINYNNYLVIELFRGESGGAKHKTEIENKKLFVEEIKDISKRRKFIELLKSNKNIVL